MTTGTAFFLTISTHQDQPAAHTGAMRVTRKRFVLLFLACGYAFHFVTRFVLDQPPEALGAVPSQQAWQSYASTALSPLKLVLIGPINWLQQDPDPPPPFRLILCAVYWSVLALGIHSLLSRSGARA
ncbi:MAG: hypothetical protein QM756_42295 [Polyangiaceae bacterium]